MLLPSLRPQGRVNNFLERRPVSQKPTWEGLAEGREGRGPQNSHGSRGHPASSSGDRVNAASLPSPSLPNDPRDRFPRHSEKQTLPTSRGGGGPRGTLTGKGPQRRGLARRRSSSLPAAGPRSHSQTRRPHSDTNNTLRAFLSGFCKRRKPRAQAQSHRYARGRGLHGSRARGTGASRWSWDLGSGGCPCREAQFEQQGRPRRGFLGTRPRAAERAASIQRPPGGEAAQARERGWCGGDQAFGISPERRRSPESEPWLQDRPESPLLYCSTFGYSWLG